MENLGHIFKIVAPGKTHHSEAKFALIIQVALKYYKLLF